MKDASHLVESEVDAKGGLSGIAIKTAFKTVKSLKPGLIPDVIDSLLEKFAEQLEPYHKEWTDTGKTEAFDAYLQNRKNRVANSLLAVTDERARVVSNATLKKLYQGLRPQGEKHVEAAVPNMSRMLKRYV
ncbi:MAG: hypothetical protein U1E65_24990 [Myxococcota bacterium]